MFELAAEFKRWGVNDWNVVGPQLAAGTGPIDPVAARRVTLTWTPKGTDTPITWVKDTQDRAVDNLRVFFLVIEALRLNELRGVSDDMAEAYLALGAGRGPNAAAPPMVTPPPRDPHEVLEVRPGASIEVIEAAYRAQSRKLGPPTKANENEYLVLNQARDTLKREYLAATR